MSASGLSSSKDGSFFVLGKRVNFPVSLVAGIVSILLWEGMVWIFAVPKWLLPPPSRILSILFAERSLLFRHTMVTLTEASSGFILALILSIILALLMDKSSLLRKILYPFIIVSQTIPIITIAPLLVIWMGFGMAPKITIVVLICFFPICISLLNGLALIDRDYLDLLKTMGASEKQIFFHLKMPSILASFFSGLKISATYSIMGAVIAEWLGAKAGLGEYMRRTLHTFSIERTFAAILIVVVLSLIMVASIHIIAFYAMPWHRSSKKIRR